MDKIQNQPPLATMIIRESYPALGYALFFSLFINLLMLTVPLYMLQLFDRVLTSQSIDTLIYLTLIAIFALIIMTLLDIGRSRILLRVGEWFSRRFGIESLSRSVDNKLRGGHYSQQCLNDVNSIRQFFSGTSAYAFFDAPWIVIYLLIIYFLSVPLGVIATIGAMILAILAYINEAMSRRPNKQANDSYIENNNIVNAMIQHAETIRSMGMQQSLLNLWFSKNDYFLNMQQGVLQRSGVVIALAKLIRLILQILILGVGAFYVIKGELSAGGMIAASIIMGRGLAPIEQGMNAWKAMLDAMAALTRLKAYLQTSVLHNTLNLSDIQGVLQVEDVSFAVPERQEPILQNIKLTLPKGKQLAIIGPVAAGKSTLARILAGIIQPTYGTARLDAADIYQLSDEARSKLCGYLSQTHSLFPGTIAKNINRLTDADEQQTIAAANYVGMHQIISHLAQGYNTVIDGYNLSVGQRQRIALARAFYANPRYVVLDEPESNLDVDGVISLTNTLKQARQEGVTVVLVTQNPQLARSADYVLVLKQGRMQEFGPAEAIVKKWLG